MTASFFMPLFREAQIMNRFFHVMISAMVLAMFTSCSTKQTNQRQTCTHELELQEVHRQLEELVQNLGVDRTQAKRETTLGLLSEVRIAVGNERSYQEGTLSEEDKKVLSVFLNNQPDILNTILEQDQFVRSLNKKRIIILPDRE